MNAITITGNVAQPPTLGESESGTVYVRFSLANNEWNPKTEQSVFNGYFDVVAFRGQAVNIAKSLRKGDHIAVTGRLTQSTFEGVNPQGEAYKASRVRIQAEEVAVSLLFNAQQVNRGREDATPEEADATADDHS
jgi:single stranded DNA-binding protein